MPGTVEYAVPMMFETGMRTYLGLEHKICKTSFKTPLCIVFGEKDYVKDLDKGVSANLIKFKK